MASPTTKAEFKEYCLRKLGKPVVEVNVSDDQLNDRIDEAVKYYQEYHYSGSHKTYLKHQVTANNITNGYIDIPENIISVINIFPIGTSQSGHSMFNIRYQITLNEIINWSSASLHPYVMAMEKMALLEEIFVGKQPIRYNKHMDKLYIDMEWDAKVNVGEYIIIECYMGLDPATYTDVWSDWWLGKYATALIKKQWGENLKKFENMQLPGGLSFNGQKIWEEAHEDVAKMEDEVINKYSFPVVDFIG